MQKLSQRTQVLTSVKKCSKRAYLLKFVGVPYIPEHFLSPDGYTSGHVALIQLYTCHHLERLLLERHFYSLGCSTKLSMQGVTRCIAALERDLLLVASTGCHHAHLLRALACRYHDLHYLLIMYVLVNCCLASTSG